MKFFKAYLVLLLALTTVSNGLAQQQAQFSMYMFNPLIANPAFAGSRDALSITALGRKQWVGVSGAPETATLSFHTPLRYEAVALGFSVLYDKIGPSQTTSLFADVAYRFQVTGKSKLALGLKIGADIFGVNYTSLDATHQWDELYSNIPNKGYFNGGFGVYWYSDDFYVGLSSPKLRENQFISSSQSNAKQVNHYLLNAGYSFKINSTFDIIPSFMVKVVPNAPIAIDANLNFLLYDRIWVGGGYRFGDAVVANIMYHFSPKFRGGYAYDYTVSDFGQFNTGSHEIMVNYDLDFLGKGFPTPRRF